MRLAVDSRLSISEPFRWSLARRSSSSVTRCSLSCRNSLVIDSTTLPRRLDRRARVDRQAAGIAIRIQLGEHRVRQPLPLADVLEQARAHAAAQQRVEHVAGEPLLVRQRIGRHSQAQVHLFQRLLVAQRDARMRAGSLVRRRRAGPAGSASKCCAHQRHQPLVRQVARGRHQQVGRRVHAGVVAADHVAGRSASRSAASPESACPAGGLSRNSRRRSRGPGSRGCPPPS